MHHKWTHVDTYIAQIKTRVGVRHYRRYYASKQREMTVSCGRSKGGGGGLIICKFCPLVKAFKINADVMLRSH